MSLRRKFFALAYDRQMASAENAGLHALRERLLASASGDVIEIGGGTGLNLPCYGPDVRSLAITEPDPSMMRHLERRAREHRPSATVLRAPAEDLPFDDHTFDVAVSTLVLCGVDDQPRALRELRRVLRPGGRLLFIEHLRSTDPAWARLQDRVNWLNRLVVCCDCNRPTLDSIRTAGFTVTEVEHTQLPKAPKFVRPAIVGSATAPASALSGPPAASPGARRTHHGVMRTLSRWWTGLSPRRRTLLGGVGLLVVAAGVVAGSLASRGQPEPVAGRPGAVLLVPGYGGSTTSLDQLATRIRGTGRTAIVVPLAGDGTGDLREQARVLDGYVNQAIGAGSGPVTVIGYSAGGVVAWLWDVDYGGPGRAGKIITLGSPLHGARIAAVGAAYDPGECPVACQQLAPGSALLTQLQRSASARPPWLSLWSTGDQTVRPPDSARLAGAVNVPLQSVCRGVDIAHSQLPTAPLVVGLVLRALDGGGVTAPAPGSCASLQSLGA